MVAHFEGDVRDDELLLFATRIPLVECVETTARYELVRWFGTYTLWKPKLGLGRFHRKAFDERIHLGKHGCFVGTKEATRHFMQKSLS